MRTRPSAAVCVDDRCAKIDGEAPATWIDGVIRDLSGNGDVTLLPRTTAFGYYDGNLVGLNERVGDHLGSPVAHHAATTRSGKFAPRPWCLRAARTSEALPTPTTIFPALCSPVRRAPTSTAMP